MVMARLSRDEWVDAAYLAFDAAGISAVAVEPLARALGTSKGSFYWHFADRRELVTAVLDRWADLETEQLIRQVEEEDGGDRLGVLLELVAHRTAQRSGESTLFTDAGALGVSEVVAQVIERRVSYVAELLEVDGMPHAEARRRGAIVVSAVIGYQQLVAGGWHPDSESDPRALVGTLFALATARPE